MAKKRAAAKPAATKATRKKVATKTRAVKKAATTKKKAAPKKKTTTKKRAAKKSSNSQADDSPKMLTTWKEVAEHFGVHRDTARKDWTTAGFPGLPISVENAEAWRATSRNNENDLTPSADDPDNDHDRVTKARVEKLVAEAAQKQAAAILADLKVKEMTDSLVQLASVERFLSELFTDARTIFKRIPHEIKASYSEDIRETLAADMDARIDMALRALRGQAETYCDLID